MTLATTVEVGGSFPVTSPAYQDAAGNAVVPATLAVRIVDPTGVLTTPAVTPAASVTYDLAVTIGGLWRYRWVATGVADNQQSVTGYFYAVRARV